jgi:Uma2 family endonuclease
MSADEYLHWAEQRPGRYELIAGSVVAMAPERVAHLEMKGELYARLRAAISAATVDCQALMDGASVRVDESTIYEPDALVRCGPRLPGSTVVIPDPIIVFEVLSPSTQILDMGAKLAGYLRLDTVRHYVLVDIEPKLLIHHERTHPGQIVTHIVRDGTLRFDPPGIGLTNLFED